MIKLKLCAGVLLSLFMTRVFVEAKEEHATIVYDDVATEISPANVEAGQLWITTCRSQAVHAV